MGISNTDLFDRGYTNLKYRLPFENKIAKNWAQRLCLDRPIVNNVPFPRASNLRWPLSDTMIEQKKAFFGMLPDSSEQICGFVASNPKNTAFSQGCGNYYDFVVKQRTYWDEEYLYCMEHLLLIGECYMKITWSKKLQVPVFTAVHPLFVITPWTATRFKEVPWFFHVMQFHKDEFINRFQRQGSGEKDQDGNTKGEVTKEQLEEVYEQSQQKKTANDQADTEGKEYEREGISRTADGGKAVVWECHYQDQDGNKRIRTLSPDNPEFNFQDDRAYSYWWKTRMISEDGVEVQELQDGEENTEEQTEWMVEHCKREYIDKKLHSARGLPEIVSDGEYALSSMLNSKQNDMVFRNAPVYYAPNGIPGNTQNFSFRPGSLLPFEVQLLNQGAPPISWDTEIQSQLRIWEQRIGSYQSAATDQNSMNDSRTAKEISFVENLTNVSVKQEVKPLVKFIRNTMRQGWRRVVQFQPKSLQYFQNSNLMSLPQAALNDDYEINVNGSADSINKEFQIQKAQTIWNASKDNPFANQGESYKNLLETVTPGQVERFYQDPQQKQLKSQQKAASDISIMLTTGMFMPPDQADDLYTDAVTAIQFLQSVQQRGMSLNPQQVNLVSQYAGQARAMLKTIDKNKYDQLTQALNQLDMQARKQAVASQVAQTLQAQGRMPAPNAMPTQMPQAAPEAPQMAQPATNGVPAL